MLLKITLSSLSFLTILILLSSPTSQLDILPVSFQILTSPILTQTQIQYNISICFSDCNSCQTTSGDCQICFTPWFQINSGSCQLAQPTYILQSTLQEQRFINFIASSQWLYNGIPVTSTVCTPDPQTFVNNITIIGPFTSGNVTYQRTISQHDYFAIKFLLILSNWTNSSNLQINITNQIGVMISTQNINLQTSSIKNSNLQQLCSNSSKDRRVSMTLQVSEKQSSQIIMQFISNLEPGASWSLSSFVLLTGGCHPNCATCIGYTPNLAGCDICKNFLVNDYTSSTQKCSTCQSGFTLQPSQICQKCSIQYQQCSSPTNTSCQFPTISNISQNCTLTNATYFDDKQLTQTTFYGSLYSIQSKGSATIQCGQYSVVGPANFGDIISRTFVQLPSHIAISINFNLFIFDQIQQIQRYSVIIIVDGSPILFNPSDQTINITATSNQCNLQQNVIKYDAMKTFSTSIFIPHKKQSNVVIGISLGTSSNNVNTFWGIRDIRLVFKRCDDKCQNCTINGCQKCKGLLQLNNLQCSSCLIGTGLTPNQTTCQPCPQNCLQCNITQTSSICTQCSSSYYLYQFNNSISCQRNPNFDKPISQSINNNGGCSVNISGVNSSTSLNFDVAANSAFMTVHTPQGTYKKNIQFYLIKLDDWQGDYLDIYFNDLLVKRYQFYGQGNSYCGNTSQNDLIMYQSFDYNDDNTTLTIQFQVVQNDTTKNRRFGISNFQVYPVGCSNCLNYNFIYNIKYNYDQKLFIQMQFNLVYQNTNISDFKNIFKLKIGQKYYDYDIIKNDSIRYWLSVSNQMQEIIGQNVTIQCKYPLKVIATIPMNNSNPGHAYINERQFFTQRLLQSSNTNYMVSKTLDNKAVSVQVARYTPLLGRQQRILGLQTFFSILTRIIIYGGFASFFIGCQTPCTHVMHNFQKLWVHIFVASLALTPLFKTTLWGFRQSQNQNIAINPQAWQAQLPNYLYYNTPAQYQQYYTDITFFRNIYNIGVAFAILIFVYIFFTIILRIFDKNTSILARHLKITYINRPLFYFNSIIFYQYFTAILACCFQFLDLKTKTNQSTFANINAAAAIIAFILLTLYPIIIHIILHIKRKNALTLIKTILGNNRNKQFQNHIDDLFDLQQEQVIYNNKYSQIFYRFLPKQLWNPTLSESQVITVKHLFYNLFRFGQLWWYSIIVVFLFYAPFTQAFLLVLTNGFSLVVNAFSTLNTNKYFRIMKCLQLLFFMVVQILIIVMASLLNTLRLQSYQTLGIVAIIFVFFIIVITFIRFFYTFYKIYQQYTYTKDDQDVRGVIRKDLGFTKGWQRNYGVNS